MPHGLVTLCLLGLLLGLILVLGPATVIHAQVTFTEEAVARGVVHQWNGDYFEGGGGNTGGGVALEDYDRDGDLDLFLGQVAGDPLLVLRNDGTGNFTDVSMQVGIGDVGTSKQVLVTDLDGDGQRDLLIAGWGVPVRLFRNRGDGTFENRTAGSGLDLTIGPGFPSLATGACAGDLDRDGDLDLHISFWYHGESATPEATNRLWINQGNMVFTEDTGAGVNNDEPSFQSSFADLNGDGWPDLVVAHDKQGGASYYQNLQDGTFDDLSKDTGLEGWVASAKLYVDGMGVALGDTDNDGDLDAYVTNTPQGNVMYRNDSPGDIVERAVAAGTLSQRFGWGTGFLDVDNDRLLDLYVVNTGFSSANLLYHNQGNNNFMDIAATAQVADISMGWSMASGDIDGDGDVDMVVTNDAAPTRLFVNQGTANHWTRLLLRGTVSNPDAVGARVCVTTGSVSQTREVQAGTGYLGHDSLALEIGLGADTSFDVNIEWPSGLVESHTSLNTDRPYLLIEGATPTSTTTVRGIELTVAPHPISDHSRISFTLPSPNPNATIELFDLRGRRVVRFPVGNDTRTGSVSWNSLRNASEGLAHGVYMLKLTSLGQSATRSIVLGGR